MAASPKADSAIGHRQAKRRVQTTCQRAGFLLASPSPVQAPGALHAAGSLLNESVFERRVEAGEPD